MRAEKAVATYRRLRSQPLWRLLAADHGPLILGLLQVNLYDTQRSLPASVFHERIGRALEHFREQGENLTQTPQAYVAGWLADGYLERRFPPGSSEEVYELSTHSVEAIRFVAGIEQPHMAATQSRLALVIQALVRLADETDSDQHSRVERLLAEQARIDKEIEAIRKGHIGVLPDAQALERAKEIVVLAGDLTADFRRVRDQFEQLNRELRRDIMGNEGSRGQVLDALFKGIDVIGESEAGRTFAAFWRHLIDPEQSSILADALDGVMSREFVRHLEPTERQFLLRLTRNLLEQGGAVHEVWQAFARSLRHFVQSREFQEHRRLDQLLKAAQRAALAVAHEVNAGETLHFSLDLTSARMTSFAHWSLHDPALQATAQAMETGLPAAIGLEAVSELVAQSEIDFRTLKAHIHQMLLEQPQVSIRALLERFPAEQGLGSVIGLIALGARHGIQGSGLQTVEWVGHDEQKRSARIPTFYFSRERSDEWVG